MFGDGLASILQLNGAARYWRNRGDGSFDPPRSLSLRPGRGEPGRPGRPAGRLRRRRAARTCLYPLPPGPATGHWRTDGGFDPAGYVSVGQSPTVSLSDPLVRLIDLNGDGVTDALRTGDSFELFYSDSGAVSARSRSFRVAATSPMSPSAIPGYSWPT